MAKIPFTLCGFPSVDFKKVVIKWRPISVVLRETDQKQGDLYQLGSDKVAEGGKLHWVSLIKENVTSIDEFGLTLPLSEEDILKTLGSPQDRNSSTWHYRGEDDQYIYEWLFFRGYDNVIGEVGLTIFDKSRIK